MACAIATASPCEENDCPPISMTAPGNLSRTWPRVIPASVICIGEDSVPTTTRLELESYPRTLTVWTCCTAVMRGRKPCRSSG